MSDSNKVEYLRAENNSTVPYLEFLESGCPAPF